MSYCFRIELFSLLNLDYRLSLYNSSSWVFLPSFIDTERKVFKNVGIV